MYSLGNPLERRIAVIEGNYNAGWSAAFTRRFLFRLAERGHERRAGADQKAASSRQRGAPVTANR